MQEPSVSQSRPRDRIGGFIENVYNRQRLQSAGGFPAMTGNVPFLMKDVVLLAVSLYLLKQDVKRVLPSAKQSANS
jgi:hypothetical protein